MSFLRHQRSFRPMGKEQTGSGLGAHSRLSSARMSRSRLFLGGSVSTGARFRFIGCGQNAVQWSCRSSNLQRTANSVLFGCLSRGVHPIGLSQYIQQEAVGTRMRRWGRPFHDFLMPYLRGMAERMTGQNVSPPRSSTAATSTLWPT